MSDAYEAFLAEHHAAWQDAQLQIRMAEILHQAMRWSDDDEEVL